MSDKQERYKRHYQLPHFGPEGQQKCQKARVLVVGMGALGNAAAPYLSALGVGELILVDADRIELSNLQRQILFSEEDLGNYKVDVAAKFFKKQNSDVSIRIIREFLNPENADKILSQCDLIICGPDNFLARYLVNRHALYRHIPVIYGSVSQWQGQAFAQSPDSGPCYQCLYPHQPPPNQFASCSGGGVIGPLPGLVGSMMALLATKVLLGQDPWAKLWLMDGLTLESKRMKTKKDPHCLACRQRNKPEVTFREINWTKACALNEKGARIIDIREEHELRKEESGLTHMPLSLLQQNWSLLDHYQQTPLVICCQRGVRSAYVCEKLSERGFQSLYSLRGGLEGSGVLGGGLFHNFKRPSVEEVDQFIDIT